MRISTLLNESMHTFSKTERVIARYMLQHMDSLLEATIGEVATACGTSKSMVVQLCKRLGFRGFKDLRSQLSVEQALAAREQEPEHEELRPGASVAQIHRTTMMKEIQSIQDTYELFSADAVERAVRKLLEADSIVLYGVGNSAIVAMDMYSKLIRIGLKARFHQDTHLQLLESAFLTEKSVAMVFSYTGRTLDMIRACQLARKYGACVISMTRFGGNPVSDAADIALRVAGGESVLSIGSMSSRLAMFSLVDVMLACLSNALHAQIKPLLARAAEIAGKAKA